jgi:hypothetical protein
MACRWPTRRSVLTNPKLNDETKMLFVATGRNDIAYNGTKATLAMLMRWGINLTAYFSPTGAHTFEANRQYLERFARMLYQ